MMHSDISSRHMLDVDGLAPASSARTLAVRIRADSWAQTAAGQHILACLMNLLSRQVPLVRAIDLQISKADSIVFLPNGSSSSVQHDLVQLAEWAVDDAVEVTCGSDQPVDLVLHVGNDHGADADLVVVADGWRSWVGEPAYYPMTLTDPLSSNPIGPYFAAAVAAGEVFKRARGFRRGRTVSDMGYSVWSGLHGEWAELEEGPALDGFDLHPVYLVGAGAVAQAVALLISASQLGSAYVIVIDDDRHKRPNLNRCFAAGVADLREPKVAAVERCILSADLGCTAFCGTLVEYIRDEPAVRSDIRNEESEGRYPIVLSCVDKGTSRQDIQGMWPRLIVGGSTERLTAKAILYDLERSGPCLACHNPPEPDGARLRKIQHELESLNEEDRRAYLAGAPDAELILDYLRNSATCGTLGEAALRDFAEEQSAEFSVSFVSMAAGILQFGRLIRFLIGEERRFPRAIMTSLAFLNGEIGDDDLAIDQGCHKCGGGDRSAYQSVWDQIGQFHL